MRWSGCRTSSSVCIRNLLPRHHSERVLKMLSYRCQALEHETNHANANHRLAMVQADFVVTAKPPGLGEPAEGSFYNPPLRKNFESFGMIAAAHDLQSEFPKGTKLL